MTLSRLLAGRPPRAHLSHKSVATEKVHCSEVGRQPISEESRASASSWRLTGRQRSIDSAPSTDAVDDIKPTHEEARHRSTVRKTTHGVLSHSHKKKSTDLHLQLCSRTQTPGSSWLIMAKGVNSIQGTCCSTMADTLPPGSLVLVRRYICVFPVS